MALSVDNYRKRGRERPINHLSGGLAGAVGTVAEVDWRRGEEVDAADTELESGRLEDAHIAREHVVGVHQNRAEVAQLNKTIDTYLYDIQYTRQHNKTVHTHPFNGPLSRTTQVSRYQKGKTNLDFTEARDSEWQWHQLGHMQVCTSLQTDTDTDTGPWLVPRMHSIAR